MIFARAFDLRQLAFAVRTFTGQLAPRLPAASTDSCDQPEVGTAFCSSRNMLPAVDNICHPMRRHLESLGDRMASNPIKHSQSPVSKQSSDIGAFWAAVDVVVQPSASPCGSTTPRASRHRLSSLSRTVDCGRRRPRTRRKRDRPRAIASGVHWLGSPARWA